MTDAPSVTISDIETAAGRIAGLAVRTPLLESPQLNARVGGRVLIKPECLQRTGSFKFRGAWNRIAQIDLAAAPGGVVAFSSGNHAQGVAAAAGLRGLRALIVMPADTPAIKQANTRGYGAEVVTYDRASQSREQEIATVTRKNFLAVEQQIWEFEQSGMKMSAETQQRLRDEAHRFVIEAHRARRSKKIGENPLEAEPTRRAKPRPDRR